mmetsp:Transcript_15801/g.29990  ORF Transcript_15801/g.29990 Transcript_15801/m.29990 type:complete len:235 (-) Transcript_15801:74-778(-)
MMMTTVVSMEEYLPMPGMRRTRFVCGMMALSTAMAMAPASNAATAARTLTPPSTRRPPSPSASASVPPSLAPSAAATSRGRAWWPTNTAAGTTPAAGSPSRRRTWSTPGGPTMGPSPPTTPPTPTTPAENSPPPLPSSPSPSPSAARLPPPGTSEATRLRSCRPRPQGPILLGPNVHLPDHPPCPILPLLRPPARRVLLGHPRRRGEFRRCQSQIARLAHGVRQGDGAREHGQF